MNPETKVDVVANASSQPTITNDVPVEQSKGFIKNFIKKISENKMYQYISILRNLKKKLNLLTKIHLYYHHNLNKIMNHRFLD